MNQIPRRKCVVTGSSKGIGAAAALWFAQNGHDVLVNYAHDREAALIVADQCRAAGADVLLVRADVANENDCAALADELRKHWGVLDTLVNNAGTLTKAADIKDLAALSRQDFMATYDVNVLGTFQVSRALTPLMNGRDNASIVNVSSMAAVLGTGSSIAYAASKGALNTLTLALARALAPDIRVNAVLPGMVSSNWLDKYLTPEQVQERRLRYTQRALLKEGIEPEDVAHAIGWLALNASKVTGQLIELDAGFKYG